MPMRSALWPHRTPHTARFFCSAKGAIGESDVRDRLNAPSASANESGDVVGAAKQTIEAPVGATPCVVVVVVVVVVLPAPITDATLTPFHTSPIPSFRMGAFAPYPTAAAVAWLRVAQPGGRVGDLEPTGVGASPARPPSARGVIVPVG
jgi:hypothetical protein